MLILLCYAGRDIFVRDSVHVNSFEITAHAAFTLCTLFMVSVSIFIDFCEECSFSL